MIRRIGTIVASMVLGALATGCAAPADAFPPDEHPPPVEATRFYAAPSPVRAGDDITYGPESGQCARIAVWSDGTWHGTGLAMKTAPWHSLADNGPNFCNLGLFLGDTTLDVPRRTAAGWYRICLDAPPDCAVFEVIAAGLPVWPVVGSLALIVALALRRANLVRRRRQMVSIDTL